MSETSEKWKLVPIKGANYEVSDRGNVRSLYIGRREIVKTPNFKGYPYVKLCILGKMYTYFVHKLVAFAFIGSPLLPSLEINHKDGDKWNNIPSNLEWVTRSENARHAFSIGLRSAVGSRNNHSKLDEEKVAEIRRLYPSGTWTHVSLAKRYGVSATAVYHVLKGDRWSHVGS